MTKRRQRASWHVHSKNYGVTLVELLVAMGLLALIMVLLIQIMIPGLRIWKHARAVADIEQQAMIAEDRIARALLTSVAGSIQSISSPSSPSLHAISMLSHGGTSEDPGYDSTTGNPEWSQVEIFYVRPPGTLYQTFWDGSGGAALPYSFDDDETFALKPAELASLCGNSGNGERRLADKVTRLFLEPPSSDDEETFTLHLTLTTDVPQGRRSVQRELSLVPRMRERE